MVVKSSTNGKTTAESIVSPTIPVIELDRLERETVLVPIIGTAGVIPHRFSEKARKMMLATMQGKKMPKEPKDPEAEYQAAFYKLPDGGYGIPAISFKLATIGAARYYKKLAMTELRQYMFFHGPIGVDGRQLVRITGEPVMREDVARNSNGGADLRYRPEFREWSATLRVTYVKSVLSLQSLLSLIDAGGMGLGVGDWRIEKDGENGTYMIDPDRNTEVIEK